MFSLPDPMIALFRRAAMRMIAELFERLNGGHIFSQKALLWEKCITIDFASPESHCFCANLSASH
jgi:hypothetical protein